MGVGVLGVEVVCLGLSGHFDGPYTLTPDRLTEGPHTLRLDSPHKAAHAPHMYTSSVTHSRTIYFYTTGLVAPSLSGKDNEFNTISVQPETQAIVVCIDLEYTGHGCTPRTSTCM